MREHLPAVRILIVGSGDRLAALQADSIGLTGARNGSQACDLLAERVECVRNAAGERFDQLE